MVSTRIVWIARIAGIVVLLLCMLLLGRLHGRLSDMQSAAGTELESGDGM